MSQTIDLSLTGDLASDFPAVWADFLDAILTHHSGTARPSYVATPTIWYNTTSKTFYAYDGAADVALFTLDTTNHLNLPSIGGGVNTLASSSTTDLGSVPQTAINISGTTTITSFGTSMTAGQIKVLTATSGFLLSYNGTSMIIPGAADLPIPAGETFLVMCLSSGNYKVIIKPETLSAYAPLASPAFTGTPTAPTQTAGNSTTRLATTAFVNSTALTLATGTTAVTQATGDNSTKVATTANAKAEAAAAAAAAVAALSYVSKDQNYSAVGSFCFCSCSASNPGSTYAGSGLAPAGIAAKDVGVADICTGSALTGTWRCLGTTSAPDGSGGWYFATLFQRIA